MKPTEPMFTVIDPSTGHEWKILASGRIDGFGENKIIINRIHQHINDLLRMEREYLDWEHRKAAGGISAWLSEKLRRLVAKGST